jgi:hypothetical protein
MDFNVCNQSTVPGAVTCTVSRYVSCVNWTALLESPLHPPCSFDPIHFTVSYYVTGKSVMPFELPRVSYRQVALARDSIIM